MICINIKYGCGHLGVATFAIEILRMSEIALDPHLDDSIYIDSLDSRTSFDQTSKNLIKIVQVCDDLGLYLNYTTSKDNLDFKSGILI